MLFLVEHYFTCYHRWSACKIVENHTLWKNLLTILYMTVQISCVYWPQFPSESWPENLILASYSFSVAFYHSCLLLSQVNVFNILFYDGLYMHSGDYQCVCVSQCHLVCKIEPGFFQLFTQGGQNEIIGATTYSCEKHVAN